MVEYKLTSSYIGETDVPIAQPEQISEYLATASKQEPKVYLLTSSDSGEITIGVGEPYGFVQYTKPEGLLPYLVAVEKSHKKSEEVIIFDCGGTPTEIPIDQCIPFALVVEIAMYFVRCGEIPKYIEWEEV